MRNSVGIHISYWQHNWADDLVPLVRKARETGFDVAEIPLLNPEGMDLGRLKAVLDEEGLGATCGTGLSAAADPTSPDSDTRRAGIDHIRRCIEGCSALGSTVLGGVTYAPWGVFPPGDRSAYRLRCIESLRELAGIAEDHGVVLCLEILNRFEGYLLNTVEQGVALLGEVDRPSVKLHLDTFHQHIEEDDPFTAIRVAGAHIGHMHCSENNRKMPGSGAIRWAKVSAALRDVRYTGPLVVESFVSPDGEVGADLAIRRWLSDDLDRDARAGAAFLRNEVAYDYDR